MESTLVMKKQNWILEYIEKNGPVDHLNEKFVDEYINEFQPKHLVTPYGANVCKDVNRQLANLYKSGRVTRTTVGIHGLCGAGFPKWVYVYDSYR